ncbi:MAG: hypothetical protein ABFD54_02130 [Armatimonadota bacterium]|nr:hypothetical protein [bacterium]
MKQTGCLVMVLILVLAVVAYDQYRIEQLRDEVRAISGKVHVQDQGKSKAAANGNSDLVTVLAEAERHAKNAKKLIANKKTAQAQTEIDAALKRLRSANVVSRDIVGDVADTLGSARDNAMRVFQKTWNDISEEARPAKQDIDKR